MCDGRLSEVVEKVGKEKHDSVFVFIDADLDPCGSVDLLPVAASLQQSGSLVRVQGAAEGLGVGRDDAGLGLWWLCSLSGGLLPWLSWWSRQSGLCSSPMLLGHLLSHCLVSLCALTQAIAVSLFSPRRRALNLTS